MSTTLSKLDFATPARPEDAAAAAANLADSTTQVPPPGPTNTVTPAASGEAVLPPAQDQESPSSSPSSSSSSPRGTVSMRGRYVSPGRRAKLEPAGEDQKPSAKEQPKSVVSFSPKPMLEEEEEDHGEDEKKMEPKSPPRAGIVSFPAFDDSKLNSPGGMFLAPTTPNRKSSPEEEEKKRDARDEHDAKPSPRRDREQCVATPTDFALDYGRQHLSNFDTSNVLAWLQSPTANGLFSPGGFGSMLNTPRGGVPRTPRTPTVSTSFFFSDVAALPKGDNLTTTPGRKASAQKQGNNIICISPLAFSSKARVAGGGGTSGGVQTPMNLKDVFSSPRERHNIRSMPMLHDTPKEGGRPRVPQRSSSKDPSLDAVHMAERELMEDEDLSVLLSLASNHTPKPVFRSPQGRKDQSGDNLPGLQLPMIGGKDGGGGEGEMAKLKQKPSLREGEGDGFVPPQLGMRTSGSNEVYVKPKEGKPEAERATSAMPTVPRPGPYAMAMHPGQDMHYYGMPPGGLPPGMPPGSGGSMRVVVGGPPPPQPPRNPKTGSPLRGPMSSNSPHGPPPPYHDYPGMPYPPPPPPGMYSQYGPPMGYPYQSHYPPPPPRHMGHMYGSAHGPPGPLGKKPLKPPKSATKRPLLDASVPGSNKKVRKSQEKGKKKNRSPQITDKYERQKAAEKIQAVNAASGGKNDKAAALAAAILRGVTMRPSGKWQAQLYFAGKSRYIGVFDTREKAALAYEIARERLKAGPKGDSANPKATENLVNAARKAAFDGVNEKPPP